MVTEKKIHDIIKSVKENGKNKKLLHMKKRVHKIFLKGAYNYGRRKQNRYESTTEQ